MKFFKKFAAVLIAIAMFTVGNISILPRDAVEDFMLSIKAAENVINDININSFEYVTNENREMLLSIDNPDDYFLGAASQFSVFLNGDFTANDYDCEGRLAAAGNANMGEETPYYSVGAKLENADDVAHVVIGGDTLVNFSAYGKNFVMGDNLVVGGEISEYMANGNCKVYVGELFDFEEEFKRLNECVQFLTEQEANAELIVDEYYALGWTIKGEDDNLNVITLTEEQVNTFNGGYIELTLDIPDGSYLVINVPGSHVEMPSTLVYTVEENGLKTPTYENTPLLYNLYEATSFHYTGSIQGSTLAPNADATGNQGGHVAGATIAKSFTGGMEFGYSTFELKMSKTQHNEIIDSGSCGADGDNLTWTLDSDGTLTISGEGEMKNWLLNSSPWYSNKRIGNVIIEDDVTSIGSYAFESCDSLTSITIPDSVTSIGDHAFGSCDSLTSITIPDSVTSIGSYAFESCHSLTSINANSENKYYASEDGVLFNKDKSLLIKYPEGKTTEEYEIPNSVTSIGDSSFYDCDNLTSIILPESVTNIGSYAFQYCSSLTSITIKNSECEIVDSENTISDTATIYGYSGSTTEVYAEKYNRKFVSIFEEHTHKYSEWKEEKAATVWETGEAYRVCEICLDKEIKTIDKIEIDIKNNENYGIAEFTVVDAISLLPLNDATIYIESETDGECIISTDSDGKANQILPIGKNKLSVYKEGYLIRNITINISNTVQSIPRIGLSESPMVEGRLSVHEMTYEEIIEAGIDVDAPENNHVFKYETEIEFSASIDWLSIMSYVNADGDFLGFDVYTPEDEPNDDDNNDEDDEEEPDHSDDEVIYYHHSSKPKQVGDGIPVTLQSDEEVTIFPVNEKFFLIIYGEVKWLKEMFDVELLVLNHSNTDTIEDCVAEISLPDGLSLAPMSRGGQRLIQHIDHIAEGKSKSVHWYLRGDKEGVYNINASLKGKTMPFEEEFFYEYEAKDPIKVYAGSALHMTFEMPDSAFYKDDYTVKITLENVSDKTLYGVSHLVKGFKQGKITYYSDGSQKEEEYSSETLSKSEKVKEFKPGDKIVIEVTTNILFQSEIIQKQMEEMIGKVDGMETLYNGYSAMVKCVEMFDTFGSMISNVSKNIDNVIANGVLDADKVSAISDLADEVLPVLDALNNGDSKALSIINQINDSDLLETINNLADSETVEDFLMSLSPAQILGIADEISSLFNQDDQEIENFNVFDSVRTAIELIPVRFTVENVKVSTSDDSTTEIPYSVEQKHVGARYFGVENVGKLIYSNVIAFMGEIEVPWYMQILGVDEDPTGYRDAVKYIKATEKQAQQFVARDTDNTSEFKAWVETDDTTTFNGLKKSVKYDTEKFTMYVNDEDAVLKDGVLSFKGNNILTVIPNGKYDGVLCIEYEDGTVQKYVIETVEEHDCASDDWLSFIKPMDGENGYEAKVCDTCNDVIGIRAVSDNGEVIPPVVTTTTTCTSTSTTTSTTATSTKPSATTSTITTSTTTSTSAIITTTQKITTTTSTSTNTTTSTTSTTTTNSDITPEIVASGECGADGDNLTWTLDSMGTLTISGEGEMDNFFFHSDAPWHSYRENIVNVVIENGVTSIGDNAFYSCDRASITLPNSVTSIGDYAFYSCDSLASITIPNSVTSIGDYVFCCCDSLASITIPNSVTSIGDYVFCYCDSLTSITIPNSVTSIGVRAFYSCDNLTAIDVDTNNQYFVSQDGVLFNKNKTQLIQCPEGKDSIKYVIPDSVTTIEDYAFYSCDSLASITIPDSVTTIEDYAFYSCDSLASITIPDSVTSIGDYTFCACDNLTSITISDSVTKIGYNAFFNTPWFESKQRRNPLVIVNGILIDGTTCENIFVVIPDSVTRINERAFISCDNLTSITIPDSVTSIGKYAFLYCDSLASITIPDSVTSIGEYAFDGTPWFEAKQKNNPLVIVNGILIDGTICEGDVVISEGVTSIGNCALELSRKVQSENTQNLR